MGVLIKNKKISIFLVLTVLIGIFIYAWSDVSIATTVTDCSAVEKYGVQVINENITCRNVTNKLGINRGIFVDSSDTSAMIISSQFFDIFEKRHSQLESQTQIVSFKDKEVVINFYRMDLWDGSGAMPADNQTTIYSSFKLEGKGYKISGLGPIKMFDKYTEEKEKKAHTELVDEIKELLLGNIRY